MDAAWAEVAKPAAEVEELSARIAAARVAVEGKEALEEQVEEAEAEVARVSRVPYPQPGVALIKQSYFICVTISHADSAAICNHTAICQERQSFESVCSCWICPFAYFQVRTLRVWLEQLRAEVAEEAAMQAEIDTLSAAAASGRGERALMEANLAAAPMQVSGPLGAAIAVQQHQMQTAQAAAEVSALLAQQAATAAAAAEEAASQQVCVCITTTPSCV